MKDDEPRILILETSCSVGQVALARGSEVLGMRRLDEARRHARDLIPALAELLKDEGWKARDLDAIFVSRGPGSYTGLRVGIMTAKTLTYATGCVLLGIDTFQAIALQAPPQALQVDVIVDAQKDKVYVQRFVRSDPQQPGQAHAAVAIQAFSRWLETLEKDGWISGPGIKGKEEQLQGRLLVDPGRREPDVESIFRVGLERWNRGEKDDVYTLEPLYLRPSAAEEQWRGSV
ncbi:MAG TPA: tRNA (adenosine(37)-N6)-threonylcarbamoyltransferase complex dimerization subunit type 1 TsaB [Gemmataceae bacterium]|nr:tRNA (adenosine(37)-N6)-threonylcarbamoyltransferase complex dimerization subunit type 1 TsaB [Gemmataceae bacterium]